MPRTIEAAEIRRRLHERHGIRFTLSAHGVTRHWLQPISRDIVCRLVDHHASHYGLEQAIREIAEVVLMPGEAID